MSGADGALTTARLRLDPWSPAHARHLEALAADPAVTRHIGAGEPWDAERAGAVAQAMLEHWRAHGFGWRALTERATGRVVGFAGVAHVGQNAAGLDPAEHELGCWVRPDRWRLGYATEASSAVLDEAFGRVGAPSVVVVIRAGHEASIAGSQALGFAFEREVEWQPGVRAVVLRLTADGWRASGARVRP